MNDTAILNKSDRRSKERAISQNIRAKLYKVEDNKIIYTVTSSKGDKQYLVTFLLLDITGNKLKSLRSALNGNLKIKCTCDAFLYQGYKFISFKNGVGIDPENRAPDIRNPNREGMACKHIIAALNQMKRDYKEIYAMFKAQQPKGKDKPQPTDIKDNSKSDRPTDLDVKIITDFKTACDKLYKDYQTYKKNGTDGDFADSSFYDGTDPSDMLKNLSKPVAKSLNGKFIGKCKTLADIVNLIDQKKNGFNVLLDSDVKALIKKLNSTLSETTESLINNIIINLLYS